MTFGRPPLIHNELIQVEMPLDVELDDLLIGDSPPTRPHDERATPSSCALFIASMYDVLDRPRYTLLLLTEVTAIFIRFKATSSV